LNPVAAADVSVTATRLKSSFPAANRCDRRSMGIGRVKSETSAAWKKCRR